MRISKVGFVEPLDGATAASRPGALHADFMALFPQPLPAGFRYRLGHVIEYGLPAVLSSALHRSPLPLFREPAGTGDAAPADGAIGGDDAGRGDGRQPRRLIQVSDASHSIRRERILLSHSRSIEAASGHRRPDRIHNRRFFDESFVLALQRASAAVMNRCRCS